MQVHCSFKLATNNSLISLNTNKNKHIEKQHTGFACNTRYPFLFQKVKRDIKNNVTAESNTIPLDGLNNCFAQFLKRYIKCVAVDNG